MTYSNYGSPTSTRAGALAFALLARAITNITFAVWLATRSPAWGEIFRVGSVYALIDGGCALATAVLVDALARRDAARVLGALTIADALARIATGFTLSLLPGLSDFPVALVIFFAVVGAATATLAIGALGLWLYVRARIGRAGPMHADGLLDPLAVAAVISLAIAYVLFLKPPATPDALRGLALSASAALSVVFAAAFVGAIRSINAASRATDRFARAHLAHESRRLSRTRPR